MVQELFLVGTVALWSLAGALWNRERRKRRNRLAAGREIVRSLRGEPVEGTCTRMSKPSRVLILQMYLEVDGFTPEELGTTSEEVHGFVTKWGDKPLWDLFGGDGNTAA